MQQATLLMIFVLLFTVGCQEKNKDQGVFTSQTDTLFLQTTRMKGDSLFNLGASYATFRDTNDLKQLEGFNYYPDYTIVYPENIEKMELGFIILMFDSLSYFDPATKQVLKQQNFSLADRQVLMIKGLMKDSEIFIIDQNNNKDLTDDTIRVFQDWNWKSDANLIPIRYKVDFGNKIIIETGWYKIGLDRGRLLCSPSQFLMSEFTIDNEVFVLGVADNNNFTFDFYSPIMYPFVENGISRDTLIMGDIVKLNEYIKLGGSYYKFDNLYNGSGTIVLSKESNFDRLVGTQIGMIAPSPEFKTISGETYNIKDFSDKPILIANISGCSPRSYNLYKKIVEKYSEKIHIIGIEYSINEKMGGLIVDISDSVNNDFYINYRNAYSSYDCYLINTEYRIIDKFDIFNGRINIDKHLNDKE